MMRHLLIAGIILACVLGSDWLASGQQPVPPLTPPVTQTSENNVTWKVAQLLPADGKDAKLPAPPGDDKTAKPPSGREDPTQPVPGSVLELVNQRNPKGIATKLPVIVLKGRVLSQGQAAVALLEIDGRLMMVSKQSQLSASGNLILTVVELNAAEVRLEISPSKELIILR